MKIRERERDAVLTGVSAAKHMHTWTAGQIRERWFEFKILKRVRVAQSFIAVGRCTDCMVQAFAQVRSALK